MLDRLIPKVACDIYNDRAASNRPCNDSPVNRTVSMAISMFEDNGSDFQDDEEDEIQRYINYHVKSSDEEILKWCVSCIICCLLIDSAYISLCHCHRFVYFRTGGSRTKNTFQDCTSLLVRFYLYQPVRLQSNECSPQQDIP